MFDPYKPKLPGLGKSQSSTKVVGEHKNQVAKRREEERIFRENVRLAGKIVSVQSELAKDQLAKSVAKVMTLKAIHQKEGHKPYGSQILEEFDKSHVMPARLKKRLASDQVFKPVDQF